MAFVVTFLAVLSVIILMFIDKIIEYLYPKGSLSAVEEDLDNSPYAKTLFLRKFISSFIEAILAATNNLYLMAK